MTVGFKTRIYPDEKQAERLAYYCRVYHDMWNFLVAKYKDNLPIVSSFGIKDYTPSDLILDFGETIPKRIAFGVIKRYSHTVQNYWNKISKPPKFHKYDPNKQSFYLSSQTYKIINGAIPLPHLRSEKLDMSKTIPIDMQIINKNNIYEIVEPQFTCCKGRWYISGTYKISDVEKRESLEYIGLDWGIKNFMTTSRGEFINYPDSVLREYQRIGRLQHYLDKKVKGSKNWDRLHKKMQKAYDRLENLKRNFIEQTTTLLCKDNNIAVEDFVNNRIRRSTKAVRRINTIMPNDRFVKTLQWKCDKFGTNFKRVDPSYTSRTCSCCGLVKEDIKLSDRMFVCECGNIMDRDINAAINIAARAVCCS